MDFYAKLKEILGSIITDPAQLEDALSKVDALHSTDVATLKENKETILNEKRALKTELDTLKTATAGLEGKTAEDFKKLEENIKKLTANPGDEEKLKQIEEANRIRLESLENDYKLKIQFKDNELQEKEKTISALEQAQNREMTLRELRDSLDKVGVKDVFKTTALQALQNFCYVKEVDGKKVVKYKNNGSPEFDILEGITYWSKSEEGKPFIGAPINFGAGSGGSQSGALSELMKKDFKSMTAEEKTKLYTENKEAYNRKRDESLK